MYNVHTYYIIEQKLMKKYNYPLTLLSLSNSFLNHSKSLYRLRTLDSLTLNTGKFVCEKNDNKNVY